MTRIQRRLLILAGIIVSGCATTEPLATFYTLQANSDSQSNPNQRATRAVKAYVNRAVIPSYLNRTNLASFHGNQVRYSNSAFWAAPLDQTIPQAIAADLNRLGISAGGFQPMFSPPPHSYELNLRISRCEGYDTGEVVFSGTWEIRSAGDGGAIATRGFDLRRTGWPPGDYPKLALLLTEEVSECSQRIAASLGH
jgi:uncharacterized lipoprotein YmbA